MLSPASPRAVNPPGRALSAQTARLVFSTLGLAYSSWALVVLLGMAPRNWINDLAFLPLYLLAGIGGLYAARWWAPQPRIARGWRLVGVAWLTSAGGSLAWLFNWIAVEAAGHDLDRLDHGERREVEHGDGRITAVRGETVLRARCEGDIGLPAA